MPCGLNYIPNHLIQNGRVPLGSFSIGEYLYFRCEESVKFNPFDNISLVDLSNNRSGTPTNFLSHPEDVLYNTNPSVLKPDQKFNLSIACLEIVELNENSNYVKEFKEPVTLPIPNPSNIQQNICVINLMHKPIECNYSHCAFEFHFNNTEVTFANYKATLGAKANKIIRTKCKNEISKMIIKEVLRINF